VEKRFRCSHCWASWGVLVGKRFCNVGKEGSRPQRGRGHRFQRGTSRGQLRQRLPSQPSIETRAGQADSTRTQWRPQPGQFFGLKGFRGTEKEEGSKGESTAKIQAVSKGHSELPSACSQLRIAGLDIFHPIASFSKKESKRRSYSSPDVKQEQFLPQQTTAAREPAPLRPQTPFFWPVHHPYHKHKLWGVTYICDRRGWLGLMVRRAIARAGRKSQTGRNTKLTPLFPFRHGIPAGSNQPPPNPTAKPSETQRQQQHRHGCSATLRQNEGLVVEH